MTKNILDQVDMSELSKELQQARVKIGLTQEEAAKIIDVARTTFIAIEKGERKIKADELIKLAHAYGKQINDLIRPRPKLTMSQPQFRGPTLRNQRDTEDVQIPIETLKEYIRNYYELEQITKAPSIRKYPIPYNTEALSIEEAAETVAIEERNRLRLGDSPIALLRNILEEVGLRIFYLPIKPSKFSAIYLFDEQVGGCIAVNANQPEERCRWSLAHEYGHFLVHRERATVYMDDNYQRKPGSERFADEFALYFLMPTTGLKRRVNEIRQAKQSGKDISAADLCILAHSYGVSVSAMSDRLEGMRLLPTGTWEKLKQKGFKVREAQQQLGLSDIPARKEKFPLRYQLLACEAFYDGLVTEGMLANFLEADRIDVRELVRDFVIDKENEEHAIIQSVSEQPSSDQEGM